MISEYVEQPSPRVGRALRLRVSTDAPRFRVDFCRWGSRLTPMASSDWFPGREVPTHLPYQDSGHDGTGLNGKPLAAWPAYEIPVPPSAVPGCYLAVLVEADNGRILHGTSCFRQRLTRRPVCYTPAPVFTRQPSAS
jgi:hypothetical protein